MFVRGKFMGTTVDTFSSKEGKSWSRLLVYVLEPTGMVTGIMPVTTPLDSFPPVQTEVEVVVQRQQAYRDEIQSYFKSVVPVNGRGPDWSSVTPIPDRPPVGPTGTKRS